MPKLSALTKKPGGEYTPIKAETLRRFFDDIEAVMAHIRKAGK